MLGNNKNLFTGFAVAFLVTIITLTAIPQSEKSETNTEVTWGFGNSPTCGIAIDVHENISLGNVPLDPGGVINFSSPEYGYNGNNRRVVSTESDCPGGYTLQVSVDNKPEPTSVDVLEDFQLTSKIQNTKAKSGAEITLPNNWNEFSGWGSGGEYLEIGKVNSADNTGNNWGNNINGTNWLMDYRYRMDSNDVPGGSYKVELLYTVHSRNSTGT